MADNRERTSASMSIVIAEVAPLVVASVVSERDRVVIASDSCTLTGSSEAMRLIEATRLNDRFDFNVLAA